MHSPTDERCALQAAIDTANHRPRRAPDPRVLYCARSGAAVTNDAIWHRPRTGAGTWAINLLDIRLHRAPEQRAVVDDFGNLVVVA